jgi:hypothetical protein
VVPVGFALPKVGDRVGIGPGRLIQSPVELDRGPRSTSGDHARELRAAQLREAFQREAAEPNGSPQMLLLARSSQLN